jgi:hypothetical protein
MLISTLMLLLAAPAAPPAKLTVAQIYEKSFSRVENDFVSAAEAMPEEKFNFAPTQGEFKGVRTFALQVKHVAHTNFAFAYGLLGEKLPANVDPKEGDGPPSLTSKADIIKYLKDSFAAGHRAIATLQESTLTDSLSPNPFGAGPGPTRLASANIMLWHSNDHYGQMVVYLRMNGIVPPASQKKE